MHGWMRPGEYFRTGKAGSNSEARNRPRRLLPAPVCCHAMVRRALCVAPCVEFTPLPLATLILCLLPKNNATFAF